MSYGQIFTAAFSTIALSTATATDIWEIVGGSQARTCIHEVRIGTTSIALSSLNQALGVTFIRGYDTAAAGGTAVTSINHAPSTGSRAADATVTRVSTTVASSSTATPQVVHAGSWQVIQGSFVYRPDPFDRIWLEQGKRLVVRTTLPAAITVSASITFEEVAKIPS